MTDDRSPRPRPSMKSNAKATVHRRRSKTTSKHSANTQTSAPDNMQVTAAQANTRPNVRSTNIRTSARPSAHPVSAQAKLAPKLIIGAALALVAITAIAFGIVSFLTPPSPTAPFSDKLANAQETVDDNGIVHGVAKNGTTYTIRGRETAGAEPGKVTFAAVGDQIASDENLPIADAYAGKTGDGEYDFLPFYKEVQPFLAQYDLKFINQETITATSTGWNVAGYPSFNSPDNAIDTLDAVGFNMVSFCSNHIYDIWTQGITATHEVFTRHPNLLVSGSYPSQEARNTVQMVERNGITFALLAYGYGSNGYEKSDMPNDYHLALFDENTAKTEIARAREVADVVIVYMHWGTEYDPTVTETQASQAQFLADQGVDLVIGSHNHVTQTIKMYQGPEGKTIPVVFGMSDFVSGYRLLDTILSGVFTCDFVKGEDAVTIENMKWYPCIEWSDGGDMYVRMLKDITDEELDANVRTTDYKKQAKHIHQYLNDLNMEVEVVLDNEDANAE